VRLSERARFLIDNLDLPEAAQVEAARWEHFQLAHLSDDSTFRTEDKSRQIAWSFTAAAEGVANAILDGTGSIYVSINLDEAKEKIRYARAIYFNLRINGLPRLIRDHQLGLEFDNGARLVSLPSRPPRGKARMNVYLDEFAHVQYDREIYTAALPIISKGGRLRIGSSPLGASGVHWEISQGQLRQYPGYRRKRTPWWEVYSFCTNVKLARRMAPAMSTFERVEMFGTDRIKAIYANMLEDDFQQEYECAYVDETTAWITWEVIKRNQQADLVHFHAKSVDEALGLIEQVERAISEGLIEPVLVGGLDIGRKKDLTEFVGLGKATTEQMPVRLMISLNQVEFDDQERCFEEIITRLPFTQVLVDQNGIGAQLAENLSRTGKAQGVDFTNPSKELWAVEGRIQAERGNTPLPVNRELAYQIHSIKKKVTAAKNNVFDTETNEKHHADKFWAWVLAIWAANAPSKWRDIEFMRV
jgi:phage FluMu gp28-like protein